MSQAAKQGQLVYHPGPSLGRCRHYAVLAAHIRRLSIRGKLSGPFGLHINRLRCCRTTAMTFDITQNEVRSFEGSFYRPTMIKGPITLARFSDSTRGDRGRYGRFWLYGDYVRELMRTGDSYMALIKQISQQWAICDDWGDQGLLTLVDVPPGAAVPAMWGRAKFQPKVYDQSKRATGHSYEGGALQLIIPVVDTDWQINSALAAMMTRKLLTNNLVGNPSLLVENPWVTAQRVKGRNI
jgi:hypothetical protein